MIAQVAYLLAPLLGGGIFHGLCMRHDWLPWLRIRLDRGATFRGRELFGANKTLRGPVAIGLGAALVMGLQATLLHGWASRAGLELFDYATVNGWLLGFALGFGAMCAELPNSFVKRQLGIGAGAAGTGWRKWLFYFVDQVDLLLGAWLVLALVAPVKLEWVALSLALVVVVHQLLTTVTYKLGMRASPR